MNIATYIKPDTNLFITSKSSEQGLSMPTETIQKLLKCIEEDKAEELALLARKGERRWDLAQTITKGTISARNQAGLFSITLPSTAEPR